MTRFAKRLEAEGLEICIPKLSEDEKRTFELKDLYNVRLFFAGEKNIVKNNLTFSSKENLFILTGPNRGGKTIIEQAVGIISIMASSGAFVTASECIGRPFNNILTHFPIDENLTINYGRLGEEAVRIKEIVKESDSGTLILFNETYSTTSAVDGLYLSKDLLKILKEIGAAVIFNTHIHDVARSIEEMNEWPGDSSFVSLVMEIKDNVNTFRVKRSAPESKSYAQNIAEKYGITYEQMKEERISEVEKTESANKILNEEQEENTKNIKESDEFEEASMSEYDSLSEEGKFRFNPTSLNIYYKLQVKDNPKILKIARKMMEEVFDTAESFELDDDLECTDSEFNVAYELAVRSNPFMETVIIDRGEENDFHVRYFPLGTLAAAGFAFSESEDAPDAAEAVFLAGANSTYAMRR